MAVTNTMTPMTHTMTKILVLLQSLVCYHAVWAVHNDNEAEYRVVRQGEVIKIQVGSTLHLDCPVSQLTDRPGNIMLWKKGHRVLTAGTMKVRRDPRMRLVNTDLQISKIGVHDGGMYRCEIEQDENQPLAVVHTVEILVPPAVQPEPPNGEITVRSGASVNLVCRANGNPSPSVSWTREGVDAKSLSTLKHSLTNQGAVLTLHSVTRAASGLYLCQANNGVGQPATDHIKLHVLYAPHVHAVHPVVEGGAGYKVVMVCIVHAEPAADIVWYKNSMQLDMRRGYIINKDNKRHYLTVPKVGEEDFANYTCQASNSLGKSRGQIQLRGNPAPPVFNSKVECVSRDSYRVSWYTTSYQAIQQYRLAWKQSGTYTAILTPNWISHVFNGKMKGGQDPIFGSWVIKGLKEGQGYQARVQAKNRYGWSEHSETLYFFAEPHTEEEPEPSKQSYADQLNRNLQLSGSGSSIHSYHVCLQTTVLVIVLAHILQNLCPT